MGRANTPCSAARQHHGPPQQRCASTCDGKLVLIMECALCLALQNCIPEHTQLQDMRCTQHYTMATVPSAVPACQDPQLL